MTDKSVTHNKNNNADNNHDYHYDYLHLTTINMKRNMTDVKSSLQICVAAHSLIFFLSAFVYKMHQNIQI